jgi:hypothetical protein
VSRRFVLALALGVLAFARRAPADEWYDAYEKGLQALGRKDAARAIEHLERAIRKRPEPGNDILTYGTNRISYQPYLSLARAELLAGEAAAARSALERSAAQNREPAALRLRLQAEVEALERTRASSQTEPRPAPPVSVASPSLPAAAPSAATAAAVPTATAPAPPAAEPATTPTAAPRMPPAPRSASDASGAKLPPGPAPSPEATRAPLAALVVFTEPPGALVYLDDEPIGATDPASGRLVKSGLAPGRHRVRAALGSGADAAQAVEIAPAGPTTVRLACAARARVLPWPLVAGGTSLLAAAAGLLVLLARRRSSTRSAPGATPAVAGSATHAQRTASQLSDFHESLETGALSTRPRTPSPRAPEPFGGYLLVELLGRGGMAHVYRARRGSEEMALKRPLVSFLEEPEFRERFLREAEIGRTLHHPNIIRVFERGDVSGVPYLTMELVRGETLHARVQRLGALPPRQAAELACQVAEALDYAHLKGVVHRDLKPSNIMIPAEGALKVMDYGIARARRFEGLTATGAFLGTPEYVAPETAEGRGSDPRSDLYSLGVVLYEMLTARRPFVGDSPYATIRKHCTEPPTPPSAIATAVPAALEQVVLRLLAKRPEDRYPNAEDLLIELRQYLNRASA